MDLRTGCAFWILENGLLSSFPPLARDERADVAVLGAGITGAAAAYLFTTAGANVVVVDRRDAGMGSTAASTGLLQYDTDSSLEQLAATFGLQNAIRVYRLGLDAIDDIERMSAEVGDRCGFARRPSLYLASSRRDVAPLEREHALRRAHGLDVEFLSATDVESRYGFAAHGALLARGDGEIDAYRLTHRLLQRSVSLGARVFDRTTVTRVRPSARGVELETDRGFRISARRLICASGYETLEFDPPPGGRRQSRLMNANSTWACVTEPAGEIAQWRDRCLIWETARPYFYARTTGDGRVILGGEDSRYSKRHEDAALLRKKSARLVRRFATLFPDTPIEVAYSWAGVFTETSDGLPFIGERREQPGVRYALGYGANGITFGVIAARLLCDEWMGKKHPDAELFRFDR